MAAAGSAATLMIENIRKYESLVVKLAVEKPLAEEAEALPAKGKSSTI